MPICTKCPHSKDIQAGKYASYEDSPCAKCREYVSPQERKAGFQRWTGAGALPGKGASHINIDYLIQHVGDQENAIVPPFQNDTKNNSRPSQSLERSELEQTIEQAQESFSSGTAEQVEAFRSFLRQWLRLPPAQRDSVAIFLVDPHAIYQDVADTRGCSIQAVHNQLKSAKERLPLLSGALSHKARIRGNIPRT